MDSLIHIPFASAIFLSSLLMVTLCLEPLLKKTAIPPGSIYIALGFIASECVVALGYDTGIRAEFFSNIVLFGFIPVLVFYAAIRINAKKLWENIGAILTLAFPASFLSWIIIAAITYVLMGHVTGFPFIAALLTSAILISVEPGMISMLLTKHRVPDKINVTLEGESLLNDALAILLYSIVLSIAVSPNTVVDLTDSTKIFTLTLIGSLAIGCCSGLIGKMLMIWVAHPVSKAAFSLVLVYLTFLISDAILQFSGVLSVVALGLIIEPQLRTDHSLPLTKQFWRTIALLTTNILYLLVGVAITIHMFSDRWLAMLIGIIAALTARAIVVYGLIPIFSAIKIIEPLPPQNHWLLFWGGLRGAVCLALALALPTEIDYWFTIQSLIFGVALFSLIIQASTAIPIYKYLTKRPKG